MNLSRRDPASVADNRDKVLIVEDSKFFRRLLRRTVEFRTGLVPVVASSLAEARNVIENGPDGFLLSLLDLNLSDSLRGEIVDYIQSQHIPAIVFTGQFDEATRETVLAKNVIDYVIKSNRSSLDQIIAQINRFHKNRDVTVLVVDDSRSVNEYICRLLASHGFNVLSAGNGEEALAVFGDNPGIAMVITDYNMPSIDGFELISRLREGHSKSELAIIGLSGGGDAILSARFLKIGANDYLNKPFLPEEFYCRVNQNIEIMETIRDLKDSATRDFLTGLYNRRYLMESGTQMLEAAKRQGHLICVALLDIDFFKRINDTHGHDAGDQMLKNTAGILSQRFRAADLVARYGGEEFAVIMAAPNSMAAQRILDELREDIAEAAISYDGTSLSCTISIGAAVGRPKTLEDLLSSADALLYEAKQGGRNRVVTAPHRNRQ